MEIKKGTELVVMGGVLALSLAAPFAEAGTAASTGVATASTATVTTGAAGSYVLEGFNLNISANVALSYDGNTTAVGVKSGSLKGMHTFGGSSNGGSVKQCECASVASSAIAGSVAQVTISVGC